MNRLLLAAAASLAISAAHATTSGFVVPSFTLSGPASTGTTCTPTAAASGPAANAPAGTVMFNCVVSPSNWAGGVSPAGSSLVVTNLSGNTFNLALAAAGVAQTYPAVSGWSTSP